MMHITVARIVADHVNHGRFNLLTKQECMDAFAALQSSQLESNRMAAKLIWDSGYDLNRWWRGDMVLTPTDINGEPREDYVPGSHYNGGGTDADEASARWWAAARGEEDLY